MVGVAAQTCGLRGEEVSRWSVEVCWRRMGECGVCRISIDRSCDAMVVRSCAGGNREVFNGGFPSPLLVEAGVRAMLSRRGGMLEDR